MYLFISLFFKFLQWWASPFVGPKILDDPAPIWKIVFDWLGRQ